MKTNYEKNGGDGGSTRNRLDTLAETLGVHITYHRAGQPGWYNHHRKQISLRHGMSTPQENRADRFAANLLITEDEYRQAEMLYGPHPGAIAHELGVTNHLVAVWRNTHRPATPVN